jgi:hypothetical protein
VSRYLRCRAVLVVAAQLALATDAGAENLARKIDEFLALKNDRKSLEVNKDNASAAEALKKQQ